MTDDQVMALKQWLNAYEYTEADWALEYIAQLGTDLLKYGNHLVICQYYIQGERGDDDWCNCGWKEIRKTLEGE